MHPAPKPIRNAPLALWRVAEAFLHTLHNLFGAPEDVAFRHTLTRGPYRLILSWVRVGEAMLRRLLLIEAAALPKPNTRPILWPQSRLMARQRARRLIEFFDDKPEDWRVSFRAFANAERPPRPRKPRAPKPPNPLTDGVASFHSVWPLAERYEALIRVFNDPTGYAKRLAKRLYAKAVAALRALFREPPETRHRVDHYDDLERCSDLAAARFLNSS